MSRCISPASVPSGAEERYITTPDQVKLRCYLVRDTGDRFAALYFHGNSSSIDQNFDDYVRLSKMGLAVFGVDYRGFGKSQGTPSEKGIYADGFTALGYLSDSLGFAKKNIFIFGVSIGTAVAITTAAEKDVAGMVLVAPLTTGKSYAWIHGFGLLSVAAGKSFDNRDKIKKIMCPLLVIHGSEDHVIPISMGRKVFANATTKKNLWKSRADTTKTFLALTKKSTGER